MAHSHAEALRAGAKTFLESNFLKHAPSRSRKRKTRRSFPRGRGTAGNGQHRAHRLADAGPGVDTWTAGRQTSSTPGRVGPGGRRSMFVGSDVSGMGRLGVPLMYEGRQGGGDQMPRRQRPLPRADRPADVFRRAAPTDQPPREPVKAPSQSPRPGNATPGRRSPGPRQAPGGAFLARAIQLRADERLHNQPEHRPAHPERVPKSPSTPGAFYGKKKRAKTRSRAGDRLVQKDLAPLAPRSGPTRARGHPRGGTWSGPRRIDQGDESAGGFSPARRSGWVEGTTRPKWVGADRHRLVRGHKPVGQPGLRTNAWGMASTVLGIMGAARRPKPRQQHPGPPAQPSPRRPSSPYAPAA